MVKLPNGCASAAAGTASARRRPARSARRAAVVGGASLPDAQGGPPWMHRPRRGWSAIVAVLSILASWQAAEQLGRVCDLAGCERRRARHGFDEPRASGLGLTGGHGDGPGVIQDPRVVDAVRECRVGLVGRCIQLAGAVEGPGQQVVPVGVRPTPERSREGVPRGPDRLARDRARRAPADGRRRRPPRQPADRCRRRSRRRPARRRRRPRAPSGRRAGPANSGDGTIAVARSERHDGVSDRHRSRHRAAPRSGAGGVSSGAMARPALSSPRARSASPVRRASSASW